ncbi:T9SS type A sorting domain-containing protein [Rufibacter tibetensis]|uniref:T9SS type A sorting domain-containing protein n=1 Tax=Rufibacter tibetensis TaxID=512763 RepID=UPI000B29E888|nr:T9SS type A sorting domain-containing protein [Rufibacter tibetensis]
MLKKLLGLLSCMCLIHQLNAQQLAFPGAEGFGRFTTGGRGGKVIKVTNLNDAGPGSLRAALAESGARTIVFDVSGNIVLASRLQISNGNVTIAGQTAPGDGICLQNYEMVVNADNVIIRYLRFRMGDLTRNEQDALWGRYRQNIIIDHCSMSWSIDETSSFYANKNFTMQWCLVGESLNQSFHEKNNHGYGAIWGGDKASFHHNLLAHHNNRNPRFNGGGRSGISNGPYLNEHVDFRNNVIYNWRDNSAYGGENGKYNLVNNYYKPGPATASSKNRRIMQVSFEADPTFGAGYGTFFIDGNYVHGNAAVTSNNWNGGVDYDSSIPAAQRANVRLSTPIEFQMETNHTAEQAYEAVLSRVGASLRRDAVDARIVNEVRTGTATFNGSKTGFRGIIDSQTDVGGWPVLQSLPALADTDGDGMPDAWETQKGLNPNNAADRNNDANGDGYTNLEEYLNGLLSSSNLTSSPESEQIVETTLYPNPFSLSTTFSFVAKQRSQAVIKVTDLGGKVVATLLDASVTPGLQTVRWNGTDQNGRVLPTGMYFISIQAGSEKATRRVAFIRE